MSSLKRKASEIDKSTSNKNLSKKQKKISDFCIKSEKTKDQFDEIIAKYCRTKDYKFYVNKDEWDSHYDKLVDRSFECVLKFEQDISRENFKKRFQKLKPNNPHLHKWMSQDEIVNDMITDMNILCSNYPRYPYAELFNCYTSHRFSIENVRRYIEM